MSKKDIFERISQPGDVRRKPDAVMGRERDGAVTTKVTKAVVRRRPGAEDEVAAAPVEPTRTVATVVRRRAAPVPEPEPVPEPVVHAPAPAPAPVRKPEPVVEAAPVVVPEPVVEAPAPAPAPAPVVVELEPVAAPVVAAPVEVEAPEPVKATVVVPEPVVEAPAPVAAAPAPAVAAAPVRPAAVRSERVEVTVPPGSGERPRFQGLGSAVVRPPPGYDPTNPEAFMARQRREAAAVAASNADTRTRGRPTRGVVETAAAPAAPAGSPMDQARRGRRERMQVEDAMAMAARRRKRKPSGGLKTSSPQPKAQKRKIRVDGMISVGQLAQELSLKAPVLIKKLMELGQMVTVNEMLDVDTASIIAGDFDYEIENTTFDESEYLAHIGQEEEEVGGAERPPVVTIMGHVDHGKTTLLDSIRKARVAAGEAGGITQHIGAYQVDWKGRPVTFLDTPGHAAFSAMRARGASVTDIVVVVVAADDGVQPQTIEAINHAKAAGVPIIVAVNKCDKAGVNPDSIKQRMGEFALIPEEWGGDTQFVHTSALKGEGIDALLDAILIQADVLELKANPERAAEGTVIEAKIERGRGPVASVLIQQGTLRQGDYVVLGTTHGRVRAMVDDRRRSLKEAGPSTPVELFGLSDLPRVGDSLAVVANEKNARTLAEHRSDQEKQALMAKNRRRTIDDLRRIAGAESLKTLLVVLKADVQGSLEALRYAIENISVGGTDVRILHEGVGNITESDVNLVAANGGMLMGFNVKVDSRAREAADQVGVKPELYEVIYALLDRIESSLKGLKEPVYEEQRQGSAEIRAVFNISKVGTIAGSYILDGSIARSHGARVLRDGKEIYKGKISTLKRFKDDVREVQSGYECGIGLADFADLAVGDIVETFAKVEVEAP